MIKITVAELEQILLKYNDTDVVEISGGGTWSGKSYVDVTINGLTVLGTEFKREKRKLKPN